MKWPTFTITINSLKTQAPNSVLIQTEASKSEKLQPTLLYNQITLWNSLSQQHCPQKIHCSINFLGGQGFCKEENEGQPPNLTYRISPPPIPYQHPYTTKPTPTYPPINRPPPMSKSEHETLEASCRSRTLSHFLILPDILWHIQHSTNAPRLYTHPHRAHLPQVGPEFCATRDMLIMFLF